MKNFAVTIDFIDSESKVASTTMHLLATASPNAVSEAFKQLRKQCKVLDVRGFKVVESSSELTTRT